MDRQSLKPSFCNNILNKEEIKVDENNVLFAASLTLKEHPMNNVKKNLKEKYYNLIKYFVLNQRQDEYVYARLRKYGMELLGISDINVNMATIKSDIKSLIQCKCMPWRVKYRYGIFCDVALILLDDDCITGVYNEIATYIPKNQQSFFMQIKSALYDLNVDISRYIWAENIINQFRNNNIFLQRKEVKILVTATMSAGKSTLVNALVGKKIEKMSQEVCTGNKCYIQNKPYEDNVLSLYSNQLYYDIPNKDLENISWDYSSQISTYFRMLYSSNKRICFIDTPGVNSAINKNHGKITKEALKNEKYDKIIYIFNANKLGTEEEISYLKWMAQNVDKEKVIFVLNKIDSFNTVDDSIQNSIDGIQNDLFALGFEKPLICPISAYFSLLLKRQLYDGDLSEDEEDDYQYYVKKFNRSTYDLSKYYSEPISNGIENEIITISKKCGLYGLEKVILGGTT